MQSCRYRCAEHKPTINILFFILFINHFPPVQILVARPEDSGIYVCTSRNTEGATETKVEVIVEGGPQLPSVPRASVPEPLMIVVEGQTATLRCDAHGNESLIQVSVELF